jgi:hypothetical protein
MTAKELYPKAVRDAARETKLPKSAFPPGCPFDADQVLDENFWPE